jgi:hypothetical protein
MNLRRHRVGVVMKRGYRDLVGLVVEVVVSFCMGWIVSM